VSRNAARPAHNVVPETARHGGRQILAHAAWAPELAGPDINWSIDLQCDQSNRHQC
jgi:hypothetical protein